MYTIHVFKHFKIYISKVSDSKPNLYCPFRNHDIADLSVCKMSCAKSNFSVADYKTAILHLLLFLTYSCVYISVNFSSGISHLAGFNSFKVL